MRLRLTKRAQRDLDETAEWYGLHRPWLVEGLLAGIQETLEQIIEDPERFPRVEVPVTNTARDWRRVILGRFSYLIVYFISGDAVVVAHITHASRDWTTRLSDKEE